MTDVNRSIRLQGRTAGGLTGISGSSGEIFYDNTNQTLRLFNGTTKGGSLIANRAWVASYLDWANIQNKPVIPVFSAVAVSGQYTDLTGRPAIFSGSYNDLTDIPVTPTASTSTLGLVKVDGTTITILNGVISSAGGAGTTIDSINDISDVDTLTTPPTNGQALVWNTATSLWKPGSLTAASVGLGNVTNESKVTMFTNPTFSGTVNLGSGIVNLPAGSTIGGSAVATTGLITFSGSTITTGASTITISKTTNFSSNITVSGIIGASVNALTDVDTVTTPPAVGQVLKWNGTLWAPANDTSAIGAGTDASTFDGQLPAYYLNYNNLNNKPDTSQYVTSLNPTLAGSISVVPGTYQYVASITTDGFTIVLSPVSEADIAITSLLKAGDTVTVNYPASASEPASVAVVVFGVGTVTITLSSPGVSAGTASSITLPTPVSVTGLTKDMVGLGNVANESKATMFTNPVFTGNATLEGQLLTGVTGTGKLVLSASPAFTGTVTGITATMVGLGNVANESKATLFTNPAFTGTVTGVSKSAVGLGNVENTALTTWAGSTSIVTVGTLTSSLLINNTGGFGYASGQGGAVTQTTNRTTSVSLNKLAGTIQMFATTQAQGTFSFTVNNTLVAVNDVIVINVKSTSVTGSIYIPQVTLVSAGSFRVSVYTPVAVGTNDTVVLNFLVVKGTAV